MHKVIFLDVDGVLNDHRRHPRTNYCTIERDCVCRLDRVLVETDARIVLTSAWRYLHLSNSMTMDGLRNLLHSHWIDGSRLIGVTRKDSGWMMPGGYPACDRPQQILDWIDHEGWNGPKSSAMFRCLILDNMDFVNVDGVDLDMLGTGRNFIQTDGTIGLTDADADRAIEILNGAK